MISEVISEVMSEVISESAPPSFRNYFSATCDCSMLDKKEFMPGQKEIYWYVMFFYDKEQSNICS